MITNAPSGDAQSAQAVWAAPQLGSSRPPRGAYRKVWHLAHGDLPRVTSPKADVAPRARLTQRGDGCHTGHNYIVVLTTACPGLLSAAQRTTALGASDPDRLATVAIYPGTVPSSIVLSRRPLRTRAIALAWGRAGCRYARKATAAPRLRQPLAVRPVVPARAAARVLAIASTERSTSASVVDQFETEIRNSRSPRHVVAPSQQVPSSCTRRSTRSVGSSSPTRTSTWLSTTR